MSRCIKKLCKYYENDTCCFSTMGDGYPLHAPCHSQLFGVWEEFQANSRFVKCSQCGFAVSKNVVYDYSEQDSLIFKFCPSCGERKVK